MNAVEQMLLETATLPYRAAGRFAFHIARGKLRRDPVFFSLLRNGLIRDGARVLDLGCGQFLLASLLDAAAQRFDGGDWPAGWQPPPRKAKVHGIDLRARDVERARSALGNELSVEIGDICSMPFPQTDIVVILDVLHYLSRMQQDQVLRNVAKCLAPCGRLLLRVADVDAGARYIWTGLGDRIGAMLRGELWPRFQHRVLSDWSASLEDIGFRVVSQPMSQGTPFANVLLVADRNGEGSAQ